MPKRSVDIFGPYRGPTGYDQVVRGIASALVDRKVRVGLWDFKTWSGKVIDYDPKFDELAQSSKSKLVLSFCLPIQVPSHLSTHMLTNFTMIECSTIPQAWAVGANRIDLTIVPSESSMEAWRSKGVYEHKLVKCPLGVDTSVYHPDVEPAPIHLNGLSILDEFPIRVLNVQEIGPRKNLAGLLEAWMLGTQSNSGMCLLLKLSAYSGNRIKQYPKIIAELHHRLGITDKDYAPIFQHMGMLPEADMPRLFACATHYVSASKGEGWDIPAMCAASMGRPIIVPSHTAYREWTSNETATLIDHDEETAYAQGSLSSVYNGSNWYPPKTDHLAYILSKLPSRRSTLEKRATAMLGNIYTHYTWKKCADRLIKILDKQWWRRKKVKRKKMSGRTVYMNIPSIGKKCGIAKYGLAVAKQIENDKQAHIGWSGNDQLAHWSVLAENKIAIEHIQLEYGFFSQERIALSADECNAHGVPLVITMHTVANNKLCQSYNKTVTDRSDYVVVHSKASKKVLIQSTGVDPDKVLIAPMPVVPIDSSGVEVQKLPEGKKKVGFFGFLYDHKGLVELIRAMGKVKKSGKRWFLCICSSIPENVQDGILDKVVAAINESKLKVNEDFIWYRDFMPDEAVVGYLRQCDLNVLPYKHYGSYGTSAALSMLMSADKPTLLSNVCWFNHVDKKASLWIPRKDIGRPEGFAQYIKDAFNVKKSDKDAINKSRQEWVARNTLSASAQFHGDLYRKIFAEAGRPIEVLA